MELVPSLSLNVKSRKTVKNVWFGTCWVVEEKSVNHWESTESGSDSSKPWALKERDPSLKTQWKAE